MRPPRLSQGAKSVRRLNFSPSRFRLAEGNSLSISVNTREKQCNSLAFGLVPTGQVKRPIRIQTDMILSEARVRSIGAFSRGDGQILITQNIYAFDGFFLHVTVALDRKISYISCSRVAF